MCTCTGRRRRNKLLFVYVLVALAGFALAGLRLYPVLAQDFRGQPSTIRPSSEAVRALAQLSAAAPELPAGPHGGTVVARRAQAGATTAKPLGLPAAPKAQALHPAPKAEAPPAASKEKAAPKAQAKRSVARVLYGIQTCNAPAYQSMVDAQFSTWASPALVPREHIVVVGGKKDDAAERLSEVPLTCEDNPSGQQCKEATLLLRAAERINSVDADWFFSAHEDKYIFTPELERAISAYDPRVPVVYASFGCGRAWKHNKESKNGTLPKPAGWVDPHKSCQAVWERGGMCSGYGYFVSRAALALLWKPRQTRDAFMKEYLNYGGEAKASDLTSTCLFYARGIPIKSIAVQSRCHDGGKITTAVESPSPAALRPDMRKLQSRFGVSRERGPLLFHMELGGRKDAVPGLMRVIHDEWWK